MPSEADRRQERIIRDRFTRIARGYDLANRLVSLGQDQRWRRVALERAAVPLNGRLLDVATGSGDIALLAQSQQPQSRIVGTDLTPAMLRQAQAKIRSRSGDHDRALPLVLSDGLALAFSDDTFDAVISGFLMRNVPDLAQAFREQQRVARPGGRVVCLEMTWPQRFPMHWLFTIYFFGFAPLIGYLASGDAEAYRYLPRSVKRFRDPAELAEVMTQAGLRDVVWSTMMMGTVTVHVGVKP